MKIKHWQGYGCVNATRINDGAAKLHIKVEGLHECGIERGTWDTYGLYEWLVKRFDKTVPDAMTWAKMHPVISTQSDFRMDPKKGYIDICHYYFNY